jgi:hypothetical protein
MDTKPNDENADKHIVSEEDRRNVAEIIARMPKSVSTNYSTGEVITEYKDGRVVKSTIEPIKPTVTKIGGNAGGIGKIEFKTRLGD